MKKTYYMHKSFGHIVTYQEMVKEMEEWYDGATLQMPAPGLSTINALAP